MANETFEHVVKQLKKNQTENSSGLEAVGKTVAALNDRMNKFFEGLAQQRLDDLEDRREQRKESNKVAAATGSTTTKDTKGIGFLPLLFSKTGLVGSLLAVGGALAGLRGWEISALKAIKNIRIGLSDNLTKNLVSLRAKIFGVIGLDATLKKFNDAKSGLKTPVSTQIIDAIKGLRTRVYALFGLGADGKRVVGATTIFQNPVVTRVTSAIGMLLSPLKFVADGIMTFFKTAGAGTFAFLKTIGIVGGAGALIAGGAGVLTKVMSAASRILFPIGIIMGLFGAFTKYKESEEAVGYKRFADGIGGFLETFLGAPLDMIKNLIVSGLNLIGIGVNEDGTPNNFSKMIKDFSIGEALAKLPKALVNVVEAVIKGVVALAKDPIGTGAKIITGIGNALQAAFINVMKLVIANFPGMERFAPKILQTDARKKINELKEQERILTGTLEGTSPADETKRMLVLRRLAKKAELEEMIRAGDFEQASILQKLFGLGSRITNEQEAKEALKVLADSKAADVLALQKFQQQTQEFVTLNTRLMDTASDIQDLTKALKENPNLVVDNKDLSSTTNNSYTNSQAMITQDNLGFNPDNFEFRAVR